jgi:hypothetical protein
MGKEVRNSLVDQVPLGVLHIHFSGLVTRLGRRVFHGYRIKETGLCVCVIPEPSRMRFRFVQEHIKNMGSGRPSTLGTSVSCRL